jgi:hypothetical protein
VRDCVLPFLALLGSDDLVRGTCKQPLIQLLETIYGVRRLARRGACTGCVRRCCVRSTQQRRVCLTLSRLRLLH